MTHLSLVGDSNQGMNFLNKIGIYVHLPNFGPWLNDFEVKWNLLLEENKSLDNS